MSAGGHLPDNPPKPRLRLSGPPVHAEAEGAIEKEEERKRRIRAGSVRALAEPGTEENPWRPPQIQPRRRKNQNQKRGRPSRKGGVVGGCALRARGCGRIGTRIGANQPPAPAGRIIGQCVRRAGPNRVEPVWWPVSSGAGWGAQRGWIYR